MEKNSTPSSLFDMYWAKIKPYVRDPSIPEKYQELFRQFYEGYANALSSHGHHKEEHLDLFISLARMVREQCIEPFLFQPYHQKIRSPIDYYTFGLDFIRPLVEKEKSTVQGISHFKSLCSSLERGENAIFLANHQIEADPQAISILLEDIDPSFGEKLIFVAGERVITDPLAVPFSKGCDLLCIYSKRYIDYPPELKRDKQLHNKRTMELMSELLSEGGKAIYVAPSGGRDRPNAHGVVEIASFDPQSIEMFYLMAKRAGHPTHFYPLALRTYDLLPPPQTVQVELGEARIAKRGGIHLAFGERIDMEHFPGADVENKQERRQARASYICNLVKQAYDTFKI
ncbi:MAG: 1-acyl-sn-glycerol-3-phosphate acyltransferase [Rhabdochlamydiaceae bacterium]|nr:1-acyl-sn-glycerol-3-phosphate acyltransferase [Rhabdochlamydiaceae bacterium]